MLGVTFVLANATPGSYANNAGNVCLPDRAGRQGTMQSDAPRDILMGEGNKQPPLC